MSRSVHVWEPFFSYLKNTLQVFFWTGLSLLHSIFWKSLQIKLQNLPSLSLQLYSTPCPWTHTTCWLLSYGWTFRFSPKVWNDRQCCNGQRWANTCSSCWDCTFRACFQKRNCGVKGTRVCSFVRFCPIPHQNPTAMSESSCLPQTHQQNVLLNWCRCEGDEFSFF